MSLKQDIEELIQRSEREYWEYKSHLAIMVKEYNDRCSEFDVLIGTINAERLRFRKEIRTLYDFLIMIGGSLKDDKRISVFDFNDEAPAPNQLYKEIQELSEPDFKKNGKWDFLWKGLIFTSIDHMKNKELYAKFCLEVENKKNEYDKDIYERTNQIASMKDAIAIAKIYRDIIVTVYDTVQEKIIPELELIQAFLYADAIREQIIDGESVEYVEPCSITEYKGTRQDIHYQFVKNTFDFYKISATFFQKTILTDILRDRVVTETEKQEFKKQVENIKEQIEVLESKKVS